MGSVKDLEVLKEASPESVGHGIFHFSDRYSVFDWGKMPVRIDRKGEVLALMGAFTFEMLESKGIETHYLGMEEDGEIKRLEELEGPSDKMHVKLVNVLDPEFQDGSYDYSEFRNPPVNNYLVPLEIVFRNRIPVGSSVRKRYSPPELELDIETWPQSPVSLDEPIIESSTKLEEQDRYIPDSEAREISGLASLSKIYETAREANSLITRRADEVGMRHDDGKVEFLYVSGDILLGDVAGTFDENRFTYEGVQVSKEVLRQTYKKEQPIWVDEVKMAKRKAIDEGEKNWKKFVSTDPQELGIENLISEMYQAGANEYTGMNFFEVRDLSEVVAGLKDTI